MLVREKPAALPAAPRPNLNSLFQVESSGGRHALPNLATDRTVFFLPTIHAVQFGLLCRTEL